MIKGHQQDTHLVLLSWSRMGKRETALGPKYDGLFKAARRTPEGTYILRDNMSRLVARNYAPEN